MRKKITGMLVCGVLVATILPLGVIAENSDDPEIEDRIRDVFGLFGFLPQFFFKHIDIRSAWFYEDSGNPDYLYVSLELRDLEYKTKLLEAIYVIDWRFNSNSYAACVHTNPNGVRVFLSGKTNDVGNGFEDYVICDGTFDDENNIITWEIPKNAIGDPQPGDILTNTAAVTTLRFTDESGLPLMDLLKDLALQGNKDYIIQY